MRGSIRAILGLLIALAAAGGMDNATDSQLFLNVVVAAIGLVIMASGVRAMGEQ